MNFTTRQYVRLRRYRYRARELCGWRRARLLLFVVLGSLPSGLLFVGSAAGARGGDFMVTEPWAPEPLQQLAVSVEVEDPWAKAPLTTTAEVEDPWAKAAEQRLVKAAEVEDPWAEVVIRELLLLADPWLEPAVTAATEQTVAPAAELPATPSGQTPSADEP